MGRAEQASEEGGRLLELLLESTGLLLGLTTPQPHLVRKLCGQCLLRSQEHGLCEGRSPGGQQPKVPCSVLGPKLCWLTSWGDLLQG